MTRQELCQAIYKVAHLTGDFLLRSGQHSTEYFDKYQFEAQPHLLKAIAQHLAPLIPHQTEVLAGLTMGGIPIAVALSLQTNLPVCFVRKEAKTYGTCKLAEGADIQNKEVLVIEDVVTTGGQLIQSTKALREHGAQISHALCVIDRREGRKLQENINLLSLFTIEELRRAI